VERGADARRTSSGGGAPARGVGPAAGRRPTRRGGFSNVGAPQLSGKCAEPLPRHRPGTHLPDVPTLKALRSQLPYISGVNMMCAFGVPANMIHGVPRAGVADSPVDSAVANGMYTT